MYENWRVKWPPRIAYKNLDHVKSILPALLESLKNHQYFIENLFMQYPLEQCPAAVLGGTK